MQTVAKTVPRFDGVIEIMTKPRRSPNGNYYNNLGYGTIIRAPVHRSKKTTMITVP
jgi:hypothetical protein